MPKRIFDITLSLSGIIISAPLWLLFSLAILIEDGWPVFYLQERIGKGGRIFKAIKFRSMIPDAERVTELVSTRYLNCNIFEAGKVFAVKGVDGF